MNKIILSLLLTVLVFGGFTTFAQGGQSEGEKRAEMEREKKLIELKEQERNRLGGVASTTALRIEKRYEKIATKYLKTIEREEAIMAKIISRIEKIKALGGLSAQAGNTVEAEKLIVEAKASLVQARTAYETMKAGAVSADSVEKITKETLATLKTTAKNIERYMKEAHKSLQKTIGSLRGLSQLRNATSTKED